MKRRKRIYYTAEQRELMWDRYQQGDSLADIARLFNRHHPSIERIIAETGGIRPPARKEKSVMFEKLGDKMRVSLKVITAVAVLGSIHGNVSAGIIEDFNKLVGKICQDTWVDLAKGAEWDLSMVRVSADSLFTYETTPFNSFITCNAMYLNDRSPDYGSWSVRFGTASPGKNLELKKLNSTTGKWEPLK